MSDEVKKRDGVASSEGIGTGFMEKMLFEMGCEGWI